MADLSDRPSIYTELREFLVGRLNARKARLTAGQRTKLGRIFNGQLTNDDLLAACDLCDRQARKGQMNGS